MNEFKGTPGPWEVEPNPGKGSWVGDSKGNWSALSCGRSNDEGEANAHLIAAAPDMLEALQEAIKELEFHNWHNTSTGFKIQQAINKALNINQ